MAFAGLLSWALVTWFPEDRTILGIEPYEQIEFEVLPADANVADLERGRSYYMQLCALCHGANGNGYGEFSYRMVPKPADLTNTKIMNKSYTELEAVIRDGIKGTAMAPWNKTLDTVQRNQIVGYIRYLALQRNYQANG